LRITYVLLLGLLATACDRRLETSGGGGATELAASPTIMPKPNVLVIMVDDLGFNDLAINNDNTSIHTPNLDQLAREGVRFTRHYATAVCSPARVALLTAQYPERNGFLPDGRGISPEVVTMPERLQREGYTTWHIGKWHIGDLHRTAWPDHQGFDHWFGFLNQWRLAGKHKKGQIKLSRPRYENPWLEGDSVEGMHYEGHLENVLTDKAIDVITDLSQASEPWFLNLWSYAPHTPISPAVEFANLYPDTDAGRFRALVHQLDHNIGRVLKHLDTLGVRDNTIVAVVSDNGGTTRQIDNNAPFYGEKATVLEGGLRTPLIIAWPGEDNRKKVFTQTITTMDVFPTLLESMGIEVPTEIDGVSFYNSIQTGEPAPTRTLFWEHALSYSVLSADGRWRLYSPPTFPGTPITPKLYDLRADQRGEHSVSTFPEPELAALLKEHRSWSEDVHWVKTQFVGDESGNGFLSGMSLQRTPGFGGYTFAIGVSADREGELAVQDDVWSLKRNAKTVTANFGDLVLSGSLGESKSCHSIVLSGVFYRHTSAYAGPDGMTLTLYIDGKKAQSSELATYLVVDDPTVPTVIGSPKSPERSGLIYPPIVLNTSIDTFPVWSLGAVDQRVCNRT